MSWLEIGIQIGGNGSGYYDREDPDFRDNRGYRQDPSEALNCEARRIAYMLNTGDPYAEHEGAMQLSQDLYDMPAWAQRTLIERTQMYNNPELGASLRVEPVLRQTYDGMLYDTGDRNVRVVDPYFGLDDDVAFMHSRNTGYYRPGMSIDLFEGVDGCNFRGRMPWMDRDWQRHSMEERQWWNQQNDWRDYDGRRANMPGFARPNVGVDFDLRIDNFHRSAPQTVNNVFNNINIRNYYDNRVQNNITINRPRIVEGNPGDGGVRQPIDPRFRPHFPVQNGTENGVVNGQPIPHFDQGHRRFVPNVDPRLHQDGQNFDNQRFHQVIPNGDPRFQRFNQQNGGGGDHDRDDQQRRIFVRPGQVVVPPNEQQLRRFERHDQGAATNNVDPNVLRQQQLQLQQQEWERHHKK